MDAQIKSGALEIKLNFEKGPIIEWLNNLLELVENLRKFGGLLNPLCPCKSTAEDMLGYMGSHIINRLTFPDMCSGPGASQFSNSTNFCPLLCLVMRVLTSKAILEFD
ncbi:hypothetical protein EUGRSUZ_E01484 [Eucalyptus grandis]|uniref:Uncharacterized protein n=2 Tax=Eucalyptus grandis TaxID=71139 RepID=A0ACC3KUE1_EUCGR|nr:hypothetical protein EUGRSUZ_E01484 [Eucalyptus grandis]